MELPVKCSYTGTVTHITIDLSSTLFAVLNAFKELAATFSFPQISVPLSPDKISRDFFSVSDCSSRFCDCDVCRSVCYHLNINTTKYRNKVKQLFQKSLDETNATECNNFLPLLNIYSNFVPLLYVICLYCILFILYTIFCTFTGVGFF